MASEVEPLTAVALMVVVPILFPVTLPNSSTVATSGLEDSHFKVWSSASKGLNAAISLLVFPTATLAIVGPT